MRIHDPNGTKPKIKIKIKSNHCVVAKSGAKNNKNKWTHRAFAIIQISKNSKDKTLPVVNWQRKKNVWANVCLPVPRLFFYKYVYVYAYTYVCACVCARVGVRVCAFYSIVIIECELLILCRWFCGNFFGLTTTRKKNTLAHSHTHPPNFVLIFSNVFFSIYFNLLL